MLRRPQMRSMAGWIDDRWQHAEPVCRVRPGAAIAGGGGWGQRQNVSAAFRSEAGFFEPQLSPMPWHGSYQPIAALVTDRRIGTIQQLEIEQLVEADDPIEAAPYGRAEAPRESQVSTVVCERRNRENHNLDRRLKVLEWARCEDRDLMSAMPQDARELHAIELQPALRDQRNNSECEFHATPSLGPGLERPSRAECNGFSTIAAPVHCQVRFASRLGAVAGVPH